MCFEILVYTRARAIVKAYWCSCKLSRTCKKLSFVQSAETWMLGHSEKVCNILGDILGKSFVYLELFSVFLYFSFYEIYWLCFLHTLWPAKASLLLLYVAVFTYLRARWSASPQLAATDTGKCLLMLLGCRCHDCLLQDWLLHMSYEIQIFYIFWSLALCEQNVFSSQLLHTDVVWVIVSGKDAFCLEF